jgi:hypothetical protein
MNVTIEIPENIANLPVESLAMMAFVFTTSAQRSKQSSPEHLASWLAASVILAVAEKKDEAALGIPNN